MEQNQQRVEEILKYNSTAEDYLRREPTLAIEFAQKAFELAYQIQNPQLIGQSATHMAYGYWLLGEMDKAYDFAGQAFQVGEEIEEKQLQAISLKVMGNIQLELLNYDESLSYYLRARKLNEELNNQELEGDLLNNIGEIYREHRNFNKAMELYQQSLSIDVQMEGYKNRSITYDNISSTLMEMGQFDEALHYNRLCMESARENGQDLIYVYGLFTKAEIYEKIGREEEAISLLQETKQNCQAIKEQFFLQRVLLKLIKFYQNTGKYEQALLESDQMLQIPTNLMKINFQEEVRSRRASIYEELGNLEKALEEYREYYHVSEKRAQKNQALEKTIVKVQFQNIKAKQEKELFALKNVVLKEKTESLEAKSKALESAYRRMQMIGDVGRLMTSTLNLDEILQIAYESLTELIEIRTLAVGLIDFSRNAISYKLYIEDGMRMPVVDSDLEEEMNFSTWAIRNRELLWIDDLEKEAPKYLKVNHRSYPNPEDLNHSAIFCPLILKNEVIGVITVQNKKRNSFREEDTHLIRSLSNYLAIAIYNAERARKRREEIRERELAENQLKEINYRLRDLSILDELTGVYNRRYFQDNMKKIWQRAKRVQSMVSIILIDIDRFKEYNDTYGHLEGDKCLKSVVRILNSNVRRESDFIARFGGDEFAVVLPYTDKQGLDLLLKKIYEDINSIKLKHEASDIAPYVTLSMGAAYGVPQVEERYEKMIAVADKALYQVKENNRNGFICFPLGAEEV